jgi:hypothetical protein
VARNQRDQELYRSKDQKEEEMEQDHVPLAHVDGVALKRRKVFESGTPIVAIIANASWVSGKFSPGIATDFRTLSPAIGYSLRHTSWLSTRRDDGSYFVRTDGDLDRLQQAALTDEEYFFVQEVEPERLQGRVVAFKVEKVEYEVELDGGEKESRVANNVVGETLRKPTEEELRTIAESEGGKVILKKALTMRRQAVMQAIESPDSPATGEAKDVSEASVAVQEEDFDDLPF